MFIDAKRRTNPPSVRRAMFIDANAEQSALRQEGHVCLLISEELEQILGLICNIEPLQQR